MLHPVLGESIRNWFLSQSTSDHLIPKTSDGHLRPPNRARVKISRQSASGHASSTFLGKEIALPHGHCMSLEKLIQCPRSARWPCVKTVPFEDRLDGVSRQRLDAQFSYLAQNSGVAPAVVACQLQDQLFDLLCSSRSSRILCFLPSRVLGCLLSYPAADRRWVHVVHAHNCSLLYL